MLLFENILLALNGLRSNKSRSVLTMLGIIIGIAAVIAIMTIGNSMKTATMAQMSSSGADLISVYVTAKEDDGFYGGMRFSQNKRAMTHRDYLNEEIMDSLRKEFGERIEGIGLTDTAGEGTAKDAQLYAYVTVTGENEDKLISEVPELLAGRYFYDTDYSSKRKVAIVSDYFVNNMFAGDTDAAIGSRINVVLNKRYYTYTVVGVYEYKDDGWGTYSTDSKKDTRTNLYLPLETCQEQTHHTKGEYDLISIKATDVTEVSALCDEIDEYVNDKFYRSNKNYEVYARSFQTFLDSLDEQLSAMTLAISLIAGIALLVGGIGVMNIMLVSITERTREIGTRKALGATNGSIRTQFIVESIVLCLIGGFFGIVLGLVLGSAASKMMSYPASPSIMSIVISVLFSALIGIFFGYYPANKAAKMNPIDALRYE